MGLMNEGDLGTVSYSRISGDESIGTYRDALVAAYANNANYTVTVVYGTFTITAAAPTPVPPVTPPTTPPGTVPSDTPSSSDTNPTPSAETNPSETTIEDSETPLAEINDEETPLANHEECWVHWYILLGIVVTMVYGACVATRRGLFSRKLRKYEDDLTGGDDPAPGASSGSGRNGASPAPAPKGSPTGAIASTGLSE